MIAVDQHSTLSMLSVFRFFGDLWTLVNACALATFLRMSGRMMGPVVGSVITDPK